jgi:hypothetical protein
MAIDEIEKIDTLKNMKKKKKKKIKISVNPIENIPLCVQLQSLAGTTLVTDIYHKGNGFHLFAPTLTAQYQVLHFGQQTHSARFHFRNAII